MNSKIAVYSILILMAAGLLYYLYSRQNTQLATTRPTTWQKPRVPDWHKNAVIYEVNLRHFTPENTFKSFIAHIPRLKEMGVDILWLCRYFPSV